MSGKFWQKATLYLQKIIQFKLIHAEKKNCQSTQEVSKNQICYAVTTWI